MLQPFNPKNSNIQVWVGDQLYPRSEAKVSVFDSVVQGGDAIWEGIRVYKEGIFSLDAHLERMEHSAKALAFIDVPSRAFIKKAIRETLDANGMEDETHIQNGACLIVLAEWKPLVYDNENGIKVITSSIQRNSPKHLDSKIHHNNLLNNILAKVQANVAGADAAVMLDAHGFVSELNDTNLFMAAKGVLYTPHADACLHGITRGLVIEYGRVLGIEVIERNLSINEFYNADEVFCCGTMGELTPIHEMDGRLIEDSAHKGVRQKIIDHFHTNIRLLCEPLSLN
jgi:branched-chain amino acid aminotransferase